MEETGIETILREIKKTADSKENEILNKFEDDLLASFDGYNKKIQSSIEEITTKFKNTTELLKQFEVLVNNNVERMESVSEIINPSTLEKDSALLAENNVIIHNLENSISQIQNEISLLKSSKHGWKLLVPMMVLNVMNLIGVVFLIIRFCLLA